jgi:hypothetical protein
MPIPARIPDESSDDKLDEALEMTFPASDPVAVQTPVHVGKGRKPSPPNEAPERPARDEGGDAP